MDTQSKITQTLEELKAEYLAQEAREEQAEEARHLKECLAADLNWNDFKNAAQELFPACLLPYIKIERPNDWTSTSTHLRVSIEIPNHAPMYAAMQRTHNARQWEIASFDAYDRRWGVLRHSIEHSHREKYAAGQWVGWMQAVKENHVAYASLGEALVAAEREMQNWQHVIDEVNAANAELEARAAEYLAERAAPKQNATPNAPIEPTTEEQLLAALKEFISANAPQPCE